MKTTADLQRLHDEIVELLRELPEQDAEALLDRVAEEMTSALAASWVRRQVDAQLRPALMDLRRELRGARGETHDIATDARRPGGRKLARATGRTP